MNINWEDTSYSKRLFAGVECDALYFAKKVPVGKAFTYGVSKLLLGIAYIIAGIAEAIFKGFASVTKAPLQGKFKASSSISFFKEAGIGIIGLPIVILLFPVFVGNGILKFERDRIKYEGV